MRRTKYKARRLEKRGGASGNERGEESDSNPTSSMIDNASNEWKPPRGKIPSGWGKGKPTRKGVGYRWVDPNNPDANGVRIDKGNPNNSQPTQQVDHVLVRKDGKVIGKDGRPIDGSVKDSAVEAHIPLQEWLRWRKWYEP